MSSLSCRKDPDQKYPSWFLADMPTAMVALGQILERDGYRGTPIFNGSSQVVGLEINGPNTHAEALIGDWLVEDIGIRAFAADVYAAHYDTSEE